MDMDKFDKWCEKTMQPIVNQFNDGAITIGEMVNAIVIRVDLYTEHDTEVSA